jgi:hypothetical protein
MTEQHALVWDGQPVKVRPTQVSESRTGWAKVLITPQR